MDFVVAVREVRERCLAQVHPAIQHLVTDLPERPMVMRTALFAIEDYLVVQGRPVVGSDVPVSVGISIEVLIEGVPVTEHQPQDPEEFVHQYGPHGRWVASLSSVHRVAEIVVSWYPNNDSTNRNTWRAVGGHVGLLPSRGVSTPMFSYRGTYGWPVMDALEMSTRSEIVIPHEPVHGSSMALMAVGQFDLSDDEHTLLDLRGLGGSRYTLLYDWDAKQLAITGVNEDQYYPMPNPIQAGRLAALILFGGPSGVSANAVCGSTVSGASLGRFDMPIEHVTSLVVSCGTSSSSRIVETCLWQGDEVDHQLVLNQAQTLLAYYERRLA